MNTELLTALAKKAETDKKGLVMLKTAAVRLQQFELASQLRELEKQKFPEPTEQIEAKKYARDLETLFAMVDLKIPQKTAWLIAETVKKHTKRKGNFDLKDAAELRAKIEQYFED